MTELSFLGRTIPLRLIFIFFVYDSNYFRCQASYAFKKHKYISIFLQKNMQLFKW